MLTLRRNPDADQSESYNILFERRYVGRISYVGAGAPKDGPWFWGLECHEWQGSDRPQYGNVANLDAAKAAFAQRGRKGRVITSVLVAAATLQALHARTKPLAYLSK